MTPRHRISPVTVEVMSWDGSRASIEALAWWVNTQWRKPDPLIDPCITFEFTGPNDVTRALFEQPDGDFEEMQEGDWVVMDGDEPLLVRPTWKGT